MTSRKITRPDCYGCDNEFYMSGGNGNTKECWSYGDAKLSLGRMHHKDTLPKNYNGPWKLIPNCFIYQNGYVERENEKM